MDIFLTIVPYLVIACILLWTLFRTTNALIAAEAARMAEEQQRANARHLKRAWEKKQAVGMVVTKSRCYYYPAHASVFGRRQGVEL
jgi:hypothetical protein